jgi:hypothetical protein
VPKPKKSNRQSVKPVFKMFCEGEKTEPLYIKGYINYFHSDKRNIIVVEDTNKNTPVQLVDVAINAKAQGNDKDVIWVLFDRESEVKYEHELHAGARQKALANGIQIAFSNVCFEFWILLHFRYTTGSYSSYDDLKKNSSLSRDLQTIGIKNYDKALPILFDKLKDLVPDAITNSKRLVIQALKTAEKGKSAPHYLNPYVDVHEMFLDMEMFIDGKKSVRD